MAKPITMTPTQLRLYKESVIREYKLRQESQHRYKTLNVVLQRLRKIVPLNITIGLVASISLIFMKGWGTLLQVFLTSVIWITLTSTIIGAIIGKK